MIKFFKKIRKQFLSENKFRKYLIYAIGEIILVVIGILIAVSINNWNESRKLEQTELKLLVAINDDLQKTLKDVKGDTHLNKLSLNAAIHIQKYLKGEEQLTDSLILNFEIAAFDYKLYDLKAAYKSLQSKGIEVISDINIRSKIVYFYESSVPFLKRNENPPRLFHNMLFPYYQEHFKINTEIPIQVYFNHPHLDIKYKNTLAGFIPINEDFIKSDPKFKIILREVIYNRSQILDLYEKELLILSKLVENINQKIMKG